MLFNIYRQVKNPRQRMTNNILLRLRLKIKMNLDPKNNRTRFINWNSYAQL